jgi:hypothetical protein
MDFGTTPCGSKMALVPLSRRSYPRSSLDLILKSMRSWIANSKCTLILHIVYTNHINHILHFDKLMSDTNRVAWTPRKSP